MTKEIFKTEPFEHQKKAFDISKNKKNFAYFMEMGCVDGETEFLSNRGWVKFKDFSTQRSEDKLQYPLLVASLQDDPDYLNNFSMSFVAPESFIEKDVNRFYHLTGTKLDMMLTEEHDMITCFTEEKHTEYHKFCPKNKNGKYQSNYMRKRINHFSEDMKPVKVHEYVQDINSNFKGVKHGDSDKKLSKYRVPVFCSKYTGVQEGFQETNEITQLSNAELRLMVAIIADGHFPNKRDDRCVLEFKKERKIERIEDILTRAGIIYIKEMIKKTSGPVAKYQFIAPVRTKEFDERFWVLSPEQKKIIFDEFVHWDGHQRKVYHTKTLHQNKTYEFFSKSKASVDFIQHVCSMQGYYASISTWSKKVKTIDAMNDRKVYAYDFYTVRCYVNVEDYSTSRWAPITESEILEGDKLPSTKAYCFRVPSGRLLLRRNNKIFVTGNSGKTKVMIDNMAYLHANKHITGALILAPKGVYRNWSEKEIPTHLSDDIDRELFVWKAEATPKYKDKLLKDIKNESLDSLSILVFNIESLCSDSAKKIIDAFIKKHDGNILAIVDESTCIKNHKAVRTKEAIEVGHRCKIRRIATGSPITNSPLDLFAQCAFLSKNLLGCGSYYAFKNRHAVIQKRTTRQGQSYEEIISYKNLELLSRLLEQFSFRITKKECLDLPDKIYTTRDVPLTKEQIVVYKDMFEREVAHFNDEEMSVQVALTKMLRLHQVLCGCFVADDGVYHSIPNNRLTALHEILDESSGKAIIWANYIMNIRDITESIEKRYGKESYVTYYGDTSDEDRVSAIKEFQDPDSSVRFFIGNVQTAGRGITLTEASTVIYYSNNFSLEMRQQSEDRAHRLGQKNNVTYIDLITRNSLDEKIIKALIGKRNIANEVLKDELDEWIVLS